MKKFSKITGLSLLEYQVLADAFHIGEMFCYQFDEERIEKEDLQSLYNKAIFTLYQRHALKVDEEGMHVDEEIRMFFQILQRCEKVLVIEQPNDGKAPCCLYLSTDQRIAGVLPGKREDEYIRFFITDEDDVAEVLKDLDLIVWGVLTEGLEESCEDIPFTGELSEGVLNHDRLEKAKDVVILYDLADAVQKRIMSSFCVVRQPIQDKLIILEGTEVQIEPYSPDRFKMHLESAVYGGRR